MDEERIALFLDYENLAIGAREHLRGAAFDFGPIADAIADRGRIVVKRAYADWTMFDDGRRMLARQNVELIEIPQKLGAVRKNAADIKLAVDAIELAFERDYITTYVLCTGDSDFTPLVAKLRELNKRVIGIGVAGSTSALLPPSVDEFLFYDRLEGIEPGPGRKRDTTPTKSTRSRARGKQGAAAPVEAEEGEAPIEEKASVAAPDNATLQTLVTRTLTGLQRSGADEGVRASSLKRAILRRDPTFNEADYGFRAFGELLRSLEASGAVALRPGARPAIPRSHFPIGWVARTRPSRCSPTWSRNCRSARARLTCRGSRTACASVSRTSRRSASATRRSCSSRRRRRREGSSRWTGTTPRRITLCASPTRRRSSRVRSHR